VVLYALSHGQLLCGVVLALGGVVGCQRSG
jgi:hypothetical protein